MSYELSDATPLSAPTPRSSRIPRRWPTAAGIVFAAFVAFGSGMVDPTAIAPVVTASGFVYLGAAALQRRSAAWPMFLIGFIVITIGLGGPGFAPSWSSWWMLGLGTVLVAYGLIRGALRPPWGLRRFRGSRTRRGRQAARAATETDACAHGAW